MLTNNAVPSYGTQLKMSDAAGANHAAIAYVRDIQGGGFKVRTPETTTHGAGSGVPWVRKTATLVEGNQVKITINFFRGDPTHDAVQGLIAIGKTRERRNFQICYNDEMGDQIDSFDGFVANFDPKSPVDGVYTADVSFEVDGEITYDT